ncbi:NUDIX domain-containing protein [Candidatus Woesearchaeota archaeon]|nr:NUDIX domain-containing protein [Candidatus Woesearchaeota archaeon]MBW3005815.1 NUDIX domain-containing protein [Candidatus Woesearchaeota archaeon]
MTETLDVVDEKDEVIATASRKECHEKKIRHRGVQVFILNEEGDFFIQKRSPKKDIFPGLYEGGITGHVLSGETYKQAAVRELKEELGINIHENDLREMFSFKILFENEHELITAYLLDYDGQIKIDQDEVVSGQFLSLDELKQKIKDNEKEFTPAFLIGFDKYMEVKDIV